MKRVLIVLALFATLTAGAQSKSPAAIVKAVEKAEQTVQNPKKAEDFNSWFKLGEAYYQAYANPTANVLGSTRQELEFVMGNDKPVGAEEVVTLGGVEYVKVPYADKNLYFSVAGLLQFTEVTKPVYQDDVLAKAVDAFAKSYTYDAKGKKTKDIALKLQTIEQNYFQDAFTVYTLGNPAEASRLFGKAAATSKTAPCAKVDTLAIYYAGLTAIESHLDADAKKYFLEAQALGYESEGGLYANLSEIEMAAGDTLAARKYLEDGFLKYPSNPQVLTSLINLYIGTKENPEKIIVLLEQAKAQMPDNPSLYYVEGDIWVKIKNYDKAVEAYRKSNEINPAYEMGFYGEGVMQFDRAVDIQNEMNDLPLNEYKKYDELSKQFEQVLKLAIEPFEKAFEISQNESVKLSAADYLKRIYFVYRSEYQTEYEKYEAYLKAAGLGE